MNTDSHKVTGEKMILLIFLVVLFNNDQQLLIYCNYTLYVLYVETGEKYCKQSVVMTTPVLLPPPLPLSAGGLYHSGLTWIKWWFISVAPQFKSLGL